MKNTLAIIPVLVLSHLMIFAAGERNPAGGRAASLGWAGVTLTDLWSQVNNQAGSAWVSELSAGISAMSPYLIQGVGRYQMVGVVPFPMGNLGFSLSGFGTNLYNELQIGAGFSRKFGKRFSAGAQFDYLRISSGDNYGSKGYASAELGVMWKPAQELVFGVQIVNPYPVKITDEMFETLPLTITAGICWIVSGNCIWLAEFEKPGTEKLNTRTGIEYRISDFFAARAGISTQPWTFSFGAGLTYGNIVMDVASQYHPVLGFSPTCSLSYHFRLKR